jgi:cytochrome c
MRLFLTISSVCLAFGPLAACGGEAPKAANFMAVPAPKLEDLPAPYNEADLAKGKDGFSRKCGACHFVVKDKGHMVGPNLHDVFERGVAAAGNYNYSPALKELAKRDPKWTPEMLDHWLMSPDSFAPGTAMRLNGITDPAERRDLIAGLLIASRE